MRIYSLLFVVILLSCQSRQTFQRLEMSFSGGFSGEKVTYEVKTSGSIIRHSSIKDETQTVGHLSKQDLQTLVILLDQLLAFYPSKENTGNITRSIVWESEGKKYETSWAPDMPALSAPDMVFGFLLSRLNNP